MVNNQEWFNNSEEYSKEKREAIIEYEEFEGQLVIEEYQELERLYLRDNENIDKVVLRNLEKLQECEIWKCGAKELVIENCPQIKILDVRNNSLTNLEFLKDLENLKELKLDNNAEISSGLEYLPITLKNFSCKSTRLVEFLEPYQGDWKKCQKDVKEALEIIQRNPYLARTIQDLKEKLEDYSSSSKLISLDNPNELEKKYKELKRDLVFLVQEKEKEIKTQELNQIVTSDLVVQLSGEQKKIKTKLKFLEDIYGITLTRIKKEEQELEDLKVTYLEKSGSYGRNKLQKKLAELLEFQIDITILNAPSATKEKEKIVEKLIKKTLLNKEELNHICQFQTRITQSKIKFQKEFNREEREIQKTININANQSIINFENTFYDSSSAGTINAQIETLPK